MKYNWDKALAQANVHASAGRFVDAKCLCLKVARQYLNNLDALLSSGGLLLSCGFLSDAEYCFNLARRSTPGDVRSLVNLANLASQRADHQTTHGIYFQLVQALPDNSVIRRNAISALEYDPSVGSEERKQAVLEWGHWAERRVGGPFPRPEVSSLKGRRLRVGYVSADICQHTVGLLIKDVLAAHRETEAFVYSAGTVADWVTDNIKENTSFRDISADDDTALVREIEQDQIDVLVDLSGHTAGSRLTAFAYRPAPVMVSWLGYFATTGLPCLDAILLDEWHVPAGTEDRFVEPIVRLKNGRFFYQPVPFAPPVSPLPCMDRDYVTFGSFNNTAKLNQQVCALWAKVLLAVPKSRLVLKWRTFNDVDMQKKFTDAFEKLGVNPRRIELRGPSFHGDMLAEYGDIDIALDPFPFTGGLTSCEALWMGVPVVTLPGERAVSRQTFALLNQIGLSGLSARDGDDYVRIASDLASDAQRLQDCRTELRERMEKSPLCDIKAFTAELENKLISLYNEIAVRESTKP